MNVTWRIINLELPTASDTSCICNDTDCCNEKDAQELLGNVNIATLRNIYTHVSKTKKSEIA